MAQITRGNFGNSIPEARRTQPAQFDNQVGNAVANLADTGVRIGGAVIQQENARKAQEAQDMEQAQKEQMRDQLRRDKELRDEQDKVTTITKQADYQLAITDSANGIAARVKAGELTPEQANQEYDNAYTKTLEATTKGLRPDMVPLITAQAYAFSQSKKDNLTNAYRDRAKSEVEGSVVTYQEQMQRLAQTDPRLATKQYEVFMDQMGPKAGFDADTIVKKKQAFKENVSFTQATTLFNNARDSVAGLEQVRKKLNSAEFADLDPQRKATMLGSLDTRITTLDNRAANAKEAADRQLDREFNKFNAFATAGRPATPEYAAKMQQQFKGTAYASTVDELLKTNNIGAGFATQPAGQRSTQLLQMNSDLNTNGATPEKLKIFNAAKKADDAVKSAINEDPLTAAVTYGVVPALNPLDLSNPDKIPGQIVSRMVAANVATAWNGGKAIPPITAFEADTIAEMANKLPPKGQAKLFQGVASQLGARSTQSMASLIAKKDPQLATGIALASQLIGTRNTADLYFTGQRALKETQVKIDTASPGATTNIYAAIDGVYTTNAAKDSAAQAIRGVYAGLIAEGRSDSRSTFDYATRIVTGGVKDHNGKKLAIPLGITEEQFDDNLKAVSPALLRGQSQEFIVGNQKYTPEQLAKTLPTLPLQTVGNGRYGVLVGDIPVAKQDGTPLILNLKGR